MPTPHRPRDPNQLAKFIVDTATRGAPPDAPQVEEKPAPAPAREKDPAAVSIGRRGGLKGGKARAAALTAEERSDIARKAAAKRWG